MSVCHGECCARVVRQPEREMKSLGRSFERRRGASYGWSSSEPSSSGRRESSLPRDRAQELNWKSSLVGAQIADADEELFLRRQSSLSSMFGDRIKQRSSELSEQHTTCCPDCRVLPTSNDLPGSRNQSGSLSSRKESSSGSLSSSRRIAKESSSILDRRIAKESSSISDRRIANESSSGRIANESSSGRIASSRRSDHGGHTMLVPGNASRLPGGDLYPSSNRGGSNPNSCALDVAHFTFGNNNKEPDPGSNGNLMERIYKKLMGQSRLHRSSSKGGGAALDESSPTVDCPLPEAQAEERSFRRGNSSKRKSLRSIVEDANTVVAANPRPKSQLAQYLRSITAASAQLVASDDDDDDLEGPSEVAWLEPDSPCNVHSSARSYATQAGSGNSKRRFSLESWSSTSCSWNLQIPVATIVSKKQQNPSTTSRFGSSDIKRVSLTGSYNGTYFEKSKPVKKSSTELSSSRSWWSDIGSGRRSSAASLWTCSGRSQMDADSAQPDTGPATNIATVQKRQVEGKAKKVTDFSMPVASSFVFQDGSVPSQVLHNSAATMMTDSDSDIYHDPVEVSEVGISGEVVPWDSALQKHSFDFVREIAMQSGSGLSSRSLSRLLFIERVGMYESHGRFNVDLQRGQKIDKAAVPSSTPRSSLDVRLRTCSGSDEKSSSKRSILSPCLPFLQSNHHSNKHEIDQKRTAMNSFTSRLGRVVSEAPSLASPIYVT